MTALGWRAAPPREMRRSVQLGGSQNGHFIEISADDVSVDLAGFQISCATFLGGSCSGDGSGVSSSSVGSGVSVKNGSTTGMAFRGVSLGIQAEVTNVRGRDNGDDGIHAGAGSTVSGNTSNNNENDGISVRFGASIQGNTAYGNGTSGTGYGLAFVGTGGAYRGNVVSTNALITATRGTVSGGIDAGGNICNGSLTCP